MPKADNVIIIAHRGSSGERPEHTLASYERAIDQGADYIEPDLVLTSDGVLVARHENDISDTTDVANHPEFAGRRTTKTIDGQQITGWFTEDFTLAELRTLRTRERLELLRLANSRFNGLYQIPTLAEIIALVRAKEAETGRTIGIYPETKHPSHFASIGLPFEEKLVQQLHRAGYRGADAPIFIQSFEVGNLQKLSRMTDLPLVQLISGEGTFPPDRPDMPYSQMMTPKGLAAIAEYADAIGPAKSWVIPRDDQGALGQPTGLVEAVHAAGMKIHIWTIRRENFFLPQEYKQGDKPGAIGDVSGEIRAYLDTGIDGLFSDNVTEAVAARNGQDD
ncbi:MAG: glycerophosphodiester phosphodiesterase [Pseudomonadota bacterium]